MRFLYERKLISTLIHNVGAPWYCSEQLSQPQVNSSHSSIGTVTTIAALAFDIHNLLLRY